ATAAVTGGDGQVRPQPLALDGAGRMSSSVYAPRVGPLEVGELADHSAGYALDRYEPTPKRKIDRPWVRLGESTFTPTELISGILERVLGDAVSEHEGPPGRLVLTHPVAWLPAQRAILGAAARAAAERLDLTVPEPEFVPEPVAAAHWYARTDTDPAPPGVGERFAVYDLGGGTFDTAVLERTADGFEVLVSGGIDPLGGYDFDHRLFTYLGERYIAPADPALWAELGSPNPTRVEVSERRRHMQTTVRLLKEALSSHPSRQTNLPGVPDPVIVTREEFDALIAEDVDRTVATLRGVLDRRGLALGDLTAIYRVGGASRTPLVGDRLQDLRVTVRAVNDPKLVVALGATTVPCEDPVVRESAVLFGRGAELEGAAAETTPAALEATIKASLSEPPKPEPPAQKTAVVGAPRKRTIHPTEKVVPAPTRRPADTLDRGAWACVLAGVAVLTVAMVDCFLPWRGDSRSIPWGPVAVLGVTGAVSATIGIRDRTISGRRGWLLAGVVFIAAAVGLVLCRLLIGLVTGAAGRQSTLLNFDNEVPVSAVLAIVGLLLILAPQRRRTPTLGAAIALLIAGTALVLASVAIGTIPDLFLGLTDYSYGYYYYGDHVGDCDQSAFAGWGREFDCGLVSRHVIALLTVAAGTGVMLLAAGVFAVSVRRRRGQSQIPIAA
ncbi:Hsp70 family protein, partial [Rhodococcus koreensis]